VRLQGKSIVITGASSGIGAATAIACAREGMRVTLAARRVDKLQAVIDRAVSQGISRESLHAVSCDVSQQEACGALIEQATKHWGTLDVVFANAGYGQESPAMNMPDEQLQAMLQTNFWGSLWTIRPAIHAMLAKRSGHVLLCSSCVAKIGLPMLSAYTMSKAMQDHLGRALRIELAGTGVHVSTVHPIGTTTEFFDVSAQKSPGVAGLFTRTPAMFMQPAEKVAKAVVKCLKKPKGEVWTSLPTRLAFGASVMMPSMTDWILRMKMGRASA
jgi:NAD(P)-dependent dehydrogenase (short-subunit alcohol dehydrogenase family)